MSAQEKPIRFASIGSRTVRQVKQTYLASPFGAAGVVVFTSFLIFLNGCESHRTSQEPSLSDKTELDGAIVDDLNSVVQLAFDLEELTKYETSFDRTVALYTMLAQAERDQLLLLLEQSQNVERTKFRHEVQVAIIRRLSATDPIIALDRVLGASILQRKPLLKALFGEWSEIDLNAAIEGAASLDGADRSLALRTILLTRDDLSDHKRLEVARSLGIEDELIRIQSEESVSRTILIPADAWSTIVNDDLSDASQLDLLIEIGREWYRHIGFEALSNIMRSFSDPQDRELLHEIIAPLVVSNPQGALGYAKSLPQRERETLGLAIFLNWTSFDPIAALGAVASFEENTSVRRTLETEMVHKWAVSDPDGILEKIELLPEELRMLAIETAIARTTFKSPQKAISQMKDVKGFLGNNSRLLARIVTEWSRVDPRAASDWLVTNESVSGSDRHRLLEVALRSLTLSDPEHALDVALSQPVDRNGRGLELAVVRELASNGHTANALELLPSVRGGSATVSALVAVGNGFIQEELPLNALEIASRVPENYKWLFYNEIFSTWAQRAPIQLFETLEGLPSADVRSRAGMQLVIFNRRNSALTDEQIEVAKSFLSERDAVRAARLEER